MAVSTIGTNGLTSGLGVTASTLTVNGNNISAVNSLGFRNRIINGAMVIDQRNAGASVTVTGNPYTLDRWYAAASTDAKYTVQQNAGSVTPPAGYTNYLGCTVGASSNVTVGSSDYFGIRQAIEGYNTSDLGFGAAGASSVTLSFWVRSSVTGTYGATLKNGGNNRSYPFTYAISAANTWEQKSVTVAGDTTGTWLTTNGVGLYITFGLGVGSTYSGTAGSWQASNLWSATGATNWISTNSATFYITGVQLEAGSVASPFERRDYGRELMMCQRYCEVFRGAGSDIAIATGYGGSPTNLRVTLPFAVTKRAAPTTTFSAGNTFAVQSGQANYVCTAITAYGNTVSNIWIGADIATNNILTNGAANLLYWSTNGTPLIISSVEL